MFVAILTPSITNPIFPKLDIVHLSGTTDGVSQALKESE